MQMQEAGYNGETRAMTGETVIAPNELVGLSISLRLYRSTSVAGVGRQSVSDETPEKLR